MFFPACGVEVTQVGQLHDPQTPSGKPAVDEAAQKDS
jgi:hypothetical protein